MEGRKAADLAEATHLHAAGDGLALVEDEVDGVPERAEERDDAHAGTAGRCQGVTRFWKRRMMRSKAAASSTASPPATTTFDLKKI